MDGLSLEAAGLLSAVEEAVRSAPRYSSDCCREASTPCRLTSQLQRLIELAPVGSPAWCFALRSLCMHLATRSPWQAALVARKLIQVDSADAEAWSALGLSLSLEGHQRSAAKAYRRSLQLRPQDARCAHNLGHLYDVAFDDVARALPLLRRAHRAMPQNAEVCASLAHALHRADEPWEALALMKPLLSRPAPAHHHALYCALLDRCRAELDDAPAPTRSRRVRERRQTVCGAPRATGASDRRE